MRTSGSRRAIRQATGRTIAIAVLTVCALAGATASAQAASVPAAPGWEVNQIAYPSSLPPGKQSYLLLQIYNIGKANSHGPVTVTDVLPPGVTATEAGLLGEPFVNSEREGGLGIANEWNCSAGSVVSCTNDEENVPSIRAGEEELLLIAVDVSSEASGSAINEVTVTGGGALAPGHISSPIEFGAGTPPFGLQQLDGWFSNADGTIDTQAGSHPYSLTATFSLNNTGELPAGQVRNLTVNLPRGVVGDPTAVPRCTAEQLTADLCPPDSQVGVDRVAFSGPQDLSYPEGERPALDESEPIAAFQLPVYNMVPPPGVPAQLGILLLGLGTRINTKVRSGSDYGISAVVNNLLEKKITFNSITVWGVPGDSSHDYQRQGRISEGENVQFGVPSQIAEAPFLTLPTACEGPQTFSAFAEPWAENGIQGPPSEFSFQTHENSGQAAGITGCDRLSFDPKMAVAPDTSDAETPAGLSVELKTPQEGLTSVEGLAASDIKDTTVTLPEGVVINPGQAHGLQTCSTAQSAVGTEGEPSCPNASKVGTDEIETPLLFHNLKGNVYVLDSNPPNLKLLVTAEGEGVNLKLVGDVHLNESTGRLTTTFSETPELPFTTFKLSFSGGAQATLYTPPRCGAYQTSSDFTPWATPSVPDAFPSSEFQVSAGVGGGPCPSGALPFAPSLTAGSTTDQAGGFTDFSLLLTRPDGQQRISTLQFKTPEGLLGMISKVPLCQEPQAAQGTCPAASQIGHTTVEAGPGPYPLVIPEPGQPPAPIYLTGPYKGAPYGLSIAVPVIAGPFNLGTVVVRSSIAVDPKTTQLTITTDPLPSILDGVPTDLRAIDAVVDKPGFMFNPTDCDPQSFSGTATSTEGASAPIASHFQMGSCRSLAFRPDFKVSTSAQSSKAAGASLDAKVVYPGGDFGSNQATTQSAISSVKVDLPVQLPSRLTTLQKACLAKVFEEDPARCPKESLVGKATAVTPVLPVPLTGPAYFVSHGGEAFPSLIIILQGYGVTVELVGTTFIKNGITSSTFKQVPDVPITSFELNLPQGPYSALAANLPDSAKGSFCGQKLVMPTLFVGQNGAVIHQNTPITASGCANAISLVSKRLKGRTLTLQVIVPAAGKLSVSARGLAKASKSSTARETVTLKLEVKRKGSFKSKLKLSFAPKSGKRLAKSVTARV